MLQLKTIHQNTYELLTSISGKEEFLDFSLAGGTALALKLGHRISVDLDFFTQNSFDNIKLSEALESYFQTVNYSFSKNSLSLTIKYNNTAVKVDFLRHGYPLLKPISLLDGVRFFSIEDVAAMKMNAIANRGAKKDFYDIYELIKIFSLKQLLNFFEKKYERMNSFTVLKSLSYFDDADLEPDPIALKEINWENVKSTILSHLKSAI